MANAEALWKTYEYILENPEEWDQVIWWCGTSGCFAGHAVFTTAGLTVSGFDLVVIPEDSNYPRDYMEEQYGTAEIEDYAKWFLDLTDEQAERLFHIENDLPTIEALIREFIAGEEAVEAS